ncbi:MAG: DNA-binding response regulator [Acidobacteria bacterium]|nr:MAG: DNA-binding response regulator [Acidobacteriota bacterium]
MRIILVGSPRNRARLRRELDASVEIAAEFETLAEARASTIAAAAILLAEHGHHDAPDDDWIEQPLTRREMEVLQLLAEGLPNKSVAERLGISDQTVKFHVASISSKLGASNRTDAVRLGLRRGLITL